VDGGERLVQAGSGPCGAGQALVEVDPVRRDAGRGEDLALSRARVRRCSILALRGLQLSGVTSPWSDIVPGRERVTRAGPARATWAPPVK
jgi:hypothetical protein